MEQSDPDQLDSISPREEAQFELLAHLQTTLKDEYFLLATESEQKLAFEKKMHTALFSYYRSTVHLGEVIQPHADKPFTSFGSDRSDRAERGERYEEEKRLLAEEGFGDAYTFVKEVVISLSKDPYLMAILIRKYQSSLPAESMASLARVIVSSMYENIVDDDVYNKDLLKIVAFCIRRLIEGKQRPSEVSLLDKGFVQVILAELIERSDTKQYGKRVVRNALLEIAKLDHPLEFSAAVRQEEGSVKASMKLERQDSSKYLEGVPRTSNYQLKVGEKRSKVRQYSDSLRLYDEKNRKGVAVKRKYRNCISNELLQELGIYEEIVFPCFSSRGKESREEAEISKQLGKMLHKSQGAQSDVTTVKNILLIFFNDVFKMLYSMPPILRISSRILFKYLSLQFTPQQSIAVVADYIINFWLVSAMRIDPAVVEANRLSQHLQANAELVGRLMKSIVRDRLEEVDAFFLQEYSQLATNLKASIANYIHEVINIDADSIDALCRQTDSHFRPAREMAKTETKIKSYCVCISMADLKCLMEMVKGAERELAEVNDRLAKRVQRIELMTRGSEIFGDKRDRASGKLYRAGKAYALFTELSLPAHLSLDYFQTYNSAFKHSKLKNLIRQVLLSMNDLHAYPEFYTAHRLDDFFCSLPHTESAALYSIDAIPLRLKLEYLQALGREARLGKVADELFAETQKRLEMFKATWSSSKDCYLRAITSINFQTARLAAKEELIRDDAKRRKLDEFFARHEIRLCLTSPKSREKELVLKTTLMREVSEEYREKLWLQNQSKCIHTALNLEFIKSLTGEPEQGRARYESHINSIMRFSQILCSLPQVKERFSMAEDSIGVKEVFFEFVQYIRDLIRAKESEFSLLLENLEWLEENIELKISKRLYDKLYPRHPLYDDIALHLRLRTLHWLAFPHLQVDPALRNEQVWDVAAAQLRLIDKLRTAAEKLHCIEETSRIIFNSYTLMAREEKAVSADDIYPLMILVLIRAAPKRLVSSINFIECFASQSKLLSKEGYCFTQLKAAIQFCDSLASDSVALLTEPAANHIDFNSRIYEKEVECGIYFMLTRNRDSPETDRAKQDRLQEYFKTQGQTVKT